MKGVGRREGGDEGSGEGRGRKEKGDEGRRGLTQRKVTMVRALCIRVPISSSVLKVPSILHSTSCRPLSALYSMRGGDSMPWRGRGRRGGEGRGRGRGGRMNWEAGKVDEEKGWVAHTTALTTR